MMILAILLLLLLAVPCAAVPSVEGELCLEDVRWICCDFRFCDVFVPIPWTGFRTDSTACAQWQGKPNAALSLSASATSPDVNTGPLPADGRLYLWSPVPPLASARAGYGYGWGYVYVSVVGDLPVQGYEPIAPGLHEWDQETGQLWVGLCGADYPAPALIGAFVIRTVGVEGQTWGSMKALYR